MRQEPLPTATPTKVIMRVDDLNVLLNACAENPDFLALERGIAIKTAIENAKVAYNRAVARENDILRTKARVARQEAESDPAYQDNQADDEVVMEEDEAVEADDDVAIDDPDNSQGNHTLQHKPKKPVPPQLRKYIDAVRKVKEDEQRRRQEPVPPRPPLPPRPPAKQVDDDKDVLAEDDPNDEF